MLLPHARQPERFSHERGIRVTDVWETREQYEKFAEEQIGPVTQEVGVSAPPQTAFHEVHNYLAAG